MDSGAFVLLKGKKKNLPCLRRADGGEHTDHGSLHAACLSGSTRKFSVAVLRHYRNGSGESTGPGSPAAFQADKKTWKRTQASPQFPSKCCTDCIMTCLK